MKRHQRMRRIQENGVHRCATNRVVLEFQMRRCAKIVLVWFNGWINFFLQESLHLVRVK